MTGVLDRVWRALGILPDVDDTSILAAQTPVHEIPELVRAHIEHIDRLQTEAELRQLEQAETARVMSARRPIGGEPLPDDVPLRPSFLPGAHPVTCAGCSTVWSSDLNLDRCWSCGTPTQEACDVELVEP